MTLVKTTYGRRSFLKATALAGGGMVLGFSWLAGCKPSGKDALTLPKEWFNINGFLKIGENGVVTIMSPNPEGGQNVKTSMPMIVAEDLDVDWAKVIVEQAPLDTEKFTRQFIGGSQAIRQGWQALRMAGASARHMLMEAAAQAWQVPAGEITTEAGVLFHKNSGKSAGYGEMASAASKVSVPKEVKLKDLKDFKIIGTPRKNVDGLKIVTGQPLFGIDTHREGMLIAMIAHPPGFGLKLKSVDDSAARAMPGIRDIFTIKVLNDDYERQHFDTCTFLEVVAIVGDSTWEVMQAKKALKTEWEPFEAYSEVRTFWGQEKQTLTIPAGLESSSVHKSKMAEMAAKPGTVRRKDGDPEAAFRSAAKVLERSYTAPFLAHNCMEPMNFFAHVTADKAELAGPLQKPEFTEKALSERLGIPLEKIDIQMTRLGGGYGRRSYAHWLLEAALISQKMNAPIKLMYTREDDMTAGIYRPAYHATFRAALDANNNLTAFHVKAGGIPESPLAADRFPAGAVDNYLAEDWTIDTNITIGSYRAPRSNFMASAEQSFLDELAETAGKDPLDFRLELLERAKTNPVGEKNDYDAARYAGVLELVKEKSGWGKNDPSGASRGVAAYFCHNSYVAHVMDLTVEDGKPVVQKVHCAVDCGIVVNPLGAVNLAEGSVVDGIGNVLYGELTFKDGVPDRSNLDKYRIIRHSEAPKAIEVHFVKNDIDPTGLGEPLYPPVMAALANALYRATGKRLYDQPFMGERQMLG
ncbi:MAG: molybdopterin-dependent oxidoreductase [Saprospiraceae bacterium]|nr:molybdopterin-dependent oxidoreductase [Saprospiraceae bacterium]MCF8252618.1 molybdopterin-dependent oxidoreductase [Saprospiraceae bacterium]MCF8282673.1 molybdopterin-dependent oxidoreductase [Bacteroidales bacterium]MCF8314176.1 molybdopterin-dependent oxidoreductase [Saprospiraceae bacterium]MCF8442970.1 molybdopterin-dependent oxidoreductase [Saprospiraceae bacterium]